MDLTDAEFAKAEIAERAEKYLFYRVQDAILAAKHRAFSQPDVRVYNGERPYIKRVLPGETRLEIQLIGCYVEVDSIDENPDEYAAEFFTKLSKTLGKAANYATPDN